MTGRPRKPFEDEGRERRRRQWREYRKRVTRKNLSPTLDGPVVGGSFVRAPACTHHQTEEQQPELQPAAAFSERQILSEAQMTVETFRQCVYDEPDASPNWRHFE